MTDDQGQTAWGQVAAALRSSDGDPDGSPDERPDAPPAVPTGWEGVARAVGKTAPAGPAATKAETAPGAPPGWGGVAAALSGTAGSDEPLGAGEPSAPHEAMTDATPGPGDDEPAGIAVDTAAVDTADEEPTDEDAADEVRQAQGGPGRSRRGGPRVLAALHRPRVGIPVAGAVIVIIVAVILAVVLPGGGLPANAVFSYNGQVTNVAEFNSQVQVLNKLNGVTPPATSNQAAYAQFLRSTAKSLAVTQMIGKLAKKRGITVSQKTTRDSLDQEVASAYNGNQATFTQALSAAGITEAQVLSALNAQQVENQLFTKVTKKVSIGDAQVAATFNAQKSSLSVPDQRAVSHIVVASQATANSIITQLQGGASFATLAQQDSLDTSTKTGGGALGTVAANQLSSPFGPAAFAATVNVPFGPIQESGGAWDVGLVTADTPAVTYGDDAQTQSGIRTYLTDGQLLQQWNAYLTAQLKKAGIRYASRYRPTQPYAPPAASLPALVAFVANAHSSTGSASTQPTVTP